MVGVVVAIAFLFLLLILLTIRVVMLERVLHLAVDTMHSLARATLGDRPGTDSGDSLFQDVMGSLTETVEKSKAVRASAKTLMSANPITAPYIMDDESAVFDEQSLSEIMDLESLKSPFGGVSVPKAVRALVAQAIQSDKYTETHTAVVELRAVIHQLENP